MTATSVSPQLQEASAYPSTMQIGSCTIGASQRLLVSGAGNVPVEVVTFNFLSGSIQIRHSATAVSILPQYGCYVNTLLFNVVAGLPSYIGQTNVTTYSTMALLNRVYTYVAATATTPGTITILYSNSSGSPVYISTWNRVQVATGSTVDIPPPVPNPRNNFNIAQYGTELLSQANMNPLLEWYTAINVTNNATTYYGTAISFPGLTSTTLCCMNIEYCNVAQSADGVSGYVQRGWFILVAIGTATPTILNSGSLYGGARGTFGTPTYTFSFSPLTANTPALAYPSAATTSGAPCVVTISFRIVSSYISSIYN